MNTKRLMLCTLCSLLCAVGASGQGLTLPESLVQIANDMLSLNEAAPHGVPSNYSFAIGGSVAKGNNIGGNQAIVWWGSLYVGPNGNSATNTLVNVRNVRLYWLNKSTNQWQTVNIPGSSIDSGLYSETFSTDYGQKVQPWRVESDGSISFGVTAGQVAHIFGPYPRIEVDNNFGGLVAVADAALVLNNPYGPDDRASASYLFGIGADPYESTTGGGIENNTEIASGRFKWVKTAYRSFAVSTLSEAALLLNPPPVDLLGVQP